MQLRVVLALALAVSSSMVDAQDLVEPPALMKAVESLLACSKTKDAICISRLAESPKSIYITDASGRSEIYPGFEESAFSATSEVSLFLAGTNRSAFTVRAFEVSKKRQEVLFYRKLDGRQDVGYEYLAGLVAVGRAVQCGFVLVGGRWRIADSYCGYVYNGD